MNWTMHEAIELFAALNFLVIGLSHMVQHKAWGEFFEQLHRQGRPGAFANGFLSLFTGSLIAAFHNVWHGLPMVLTIIGWSMVVKGFLIFVFPTWGLHSMAIPQRKGTRVFIVPGILFIAVAALLLYSLWDTCNAPA